MKSIHQAQGGLSIFPVFSSLSSILFFFLFLFYLYTLPSSSLLIKSVFFKHILSFSHQQYGLESIRPRYQGAIFKCKELVNTGSSRPNDGNRGMDGICSVLNAHLLTHVSPPGVALMWFQAATNSSVLLKVKRYLNTWYCSYFGIRVICIELHDSVS